MQDFTLIAPLPQVALAEGYFSLSAPLPVVRLTTIETTTGFSARAPSPVVNLEVAQGALNDFILTARAPVVLLTLGSTMALQAPAPIVQLSVLTGTVGGFDLTAKRPSVALSVSFENQGDFALNLPAPRMLLSVLTGTVGGFDLTARRPLAQIDLLAGSVGGFTLAAPAPRVLLTGYPAYVGYFALAAPAPYIEFSVSQEVAEAFRAWVMNTRKGSLTEYSNFDFNSFAFFNGKYYAAGPNGLVELSAAADTDGSSKINGLVRTGAAHYGSSFMKRVPRIYADYQTLGDLHYSTVISQDGKRKYYLAANGISGVQQRRIPVGKGPKSVYWQHEIESLDGADFKLNKLIVYPEVLNRRIT